MEFRVGDKVLVIKNGTRSGTVVYVKEFSIIRDFNIVEFEDGTRGHYKNEELIKEVEI